MMAPPQVAPVATSLDPILVENNPLHIKHHSKTFRVSSLLGIPVASLTYAQVLEHLEEQIIRRAKTYCVTLNLDILRLACQNSHFYETVQKADFIFADGMPLIWLSKMKTNQTIHPLPERVPGCDIVYDLCKSSHQKGYKIFMLGAGPGVADQAKRTLEERFPNIQIVGTYSPAAQELTVPERNDAIVELINQSQADILFVALGAPKQETWIRQNRDKLTPFVLIPCGASIDFIAGVQKKSPQWIGKLGLEWLFRLLCNPGRMFQRYILHDLPFLFKACYQTQLLQSNH